MINDRFPLFPVNLTMGFIWIPTLALFPLISNDFVKRSVFIVFPLCAGTLLVGVIHEQRVYGEIIPVLLPAFFLIMENLFKRVFCRGNNPMSQ